MLLRPRLLWLRERLPDDRPPNELLDAEPRERLDVVGRERLLVPERLVRPEPFEP